jgi:hypothetical protein
MTGRAAISPSPGNPGEGRGEGSAPDRELILDFRQNPHPNPLPEYRERGQQSTRPARLALWAILFRPSEALGAAAAAEEAAGA